jgi:hypothetical protein
MRRGLLCGALAALASGGCLLYTDRINHPPSVDLGGPEAVDRGAAAVFTVRVSDQDQDADSLVIEWRNRQGACPLPGAGLEVPVVHHGTGSEGRRYILDGVTRATCVFVVVRDAEGATTWQGRMVDLTSHDPSVTVKVVKGRVVDVDTFELYSTAELTAEVKADGDAPTSTWILTTPDGKSRPPDPCPEASDDVCVSLDQPGTYQLAVVVRDGEREGRAEKKLTVPADRPPCVETTMPDFHLDMFPHPASDPLRFELDVASDDGDPYPEAAERALVIWEWRFEGDPGFSRQANSYPVLSFPPSELAAHVERQLSVRLTYQDRVSRPLDHCAEARCELVPPVADHHCYQRVGWTVNLY